MSLIHVTSENFEKALQAAPGVAVVDFFATWCGPCKMLAPVIEEAAEDMPEIQFYKVDVDKEQPTIRLPAENRRGITDSVPSGVVPDKPGLSRILQYLLCGQVRTAEGSGC